MNPTPLRVTCLTVTCLIRFQSGVCRVLLVPARPTERTMMIPVRMDPTVKAPTVTRHGLPPLVVLHWPSLALTVPMMRSCTVRPLPRTSPSQRSCHHQLLLSRVWLKVPTVQSPGINPASFGFLLRRALACLLKAADVDAHKPLIGQCAGRGARGSGSASSGAEGADCTESWH